MDLYPFSLYNSRKKKDIFNNQIRKIKLDVQYSYIHSFITTSARSSGALAAGSSYIASFILILVLIAGSVLILLVCRPRRGIG